MEKTLDKVLDAEKLRELIGKNEKELVQNKIMEAAKNFKRELYLRTDFKLSETTIYYFKNNGYKVLIDYDASVTPFKYMYEISWN